MSLAAVGPLFQLAPSVTTPVLALTATIPAEITRFLICNPTDAEVLFSLYHDVGGSLVFDDTNVLFSEYPVPAHYTTAIDAPSGNSGLGLARGDTLGVQTSVIDSLVFTCYGVTADIAQKDMSQ